MQGHLSEMSQTRVSANDQRNGTLARDHQLSHEHRSPGLGDQAIQCDQKMDLNPESRFFWALSGQLRCFPLASHGKPYKSQGSLQFMWPNDGGGQWVTHL